MYTSVLVQIFSVYSKIWLSVANIVSMTEGLTFPLNLMCWCQKDITVGNVLALFVTNVGLIPMWIVVPCAPSGMTPELRAGVSPGWGLKTKK